MYQTPASIFKRMVYAYYHSNNEEINIINNIHLKILERYINIFDEVIFCIIIDDVNDKKNIKEIERKVLVIRNGDITFKTYQNGDYRETSVFYNEIFLKMKDLYGLTFFAHSKGRGVLSDINETIAFISAVYFFSLENIDSIGDYPFYGSLKMINNSPYNSRGTKYMWFYVGTFFWGDYQRVYQEKNKCFPNISSRWFDETFTGELYDNIECGSYANEFIDATIKPINAYDLIERIHGNNEIMGEYLAFYNELINLFT